jgi:protein-arginine kinase activator protein McsA
MQCDVCLKDYAKMRISSRISTRKYYYCYNCAENEAEPWNEIVHLITTLYPNPEVRIGQLGYGNIHTVDTVNDPNIYLSILEVLKMLQTTEGPFKKENNE